MNNMSTTSSIIPRLCKGTDNIPFIQCGPYRLRIHMEPFDEKYKRRAFEEIGETEEVRRTAIETLNTLIDDEQDFVLPRDDEFLIGFLRPCNLNPELAMKKLRDMYKLMFNNSKYTKNIPKDMIDDVFTSGIIRYLPYRSDGSRIIVADISKWNPKLISLYAVVRNVLLGIEMGLREPKTQLCGIHIIFDMQGLRMNHVSTLNPWIAKFIADFVKAIPLEIKGIHIVNQSTLFNIGYAIFKPFISDIKHKIILHTKNLESLFEHIPQKCLPKRFMGEVDIPDIPADLVIELLKMYGNKFQVYLDYGYQKSASRRHLS